MKTFKRRPALPTTEFATTPSGKRKLATQLSQDGSERDKECSTRSFQGKVVTQEPIKSVSANKSSFI